MVSGSAYCPGIVSAEDRQANAGTEMPHTWRCDSNLSVHSGFGLAATDQPQSVSNREQFRGRFLEHLVGEQPTRTFVAYFESTNVDPDADFPSSFSPLTFNSKFAPQPSLIPLAALSVCKVNLSPSSTATTGMSPRRYPSHEPKWVTVPWTVHLRPCRS